MSGLLLSAQFHSSQLCLWKILFNCTTTRKAHRIWNADDGRRLVAAFRGGAVVGVGLDGTLAEGDGLVELVVVSLPM